MRALCNRVHAKDPTWKLAGFIVDDPLVDIVAIREVFQCSVLICFWHVRHAWHKNLVKRCSQMEMCAEIAKELGQAVHKICKGTGTANVFEAFIEDFVDAAEFMDYFKALWYPRLGIWARALKALPLASQETCAAMEFYHNQLKLRLLNEKEQSVYERADWLVNKLDTTVHSYFWLDEYSGKEDFARYWKNEWMSCPTAWRKSLSIPDAHVIMEGRCAKVVDDQDTVHIVLNPGSEYAICDCSWSKMGNLCEHIFKTIKFCRAMGSITPSMSMYQYSQALINILHCPPFDSLVRDHAVSLALCVQMQLNAQIGPESSQDKGFIVDSSQIETGSTVKPQHISSEAMDLDDNPTHPMTTEHDNHTEAQSGSLGDEVAVESSSMITLAPQFSSKNKSTSSASFVENEDLQADTGTDTTKKLSSTDIECKSLGGLKTLEENYSATIVDVEPQPRNEPPFAVNSLDSHAKRQTTESKGGKGAEISSTAMSVGGKTEERPPPLSEAVNSNISFAERSADISEMEL